MSANAKILLIDDDADFVLINRTILESAGYVVDAANDPDTGWKKIQSWQPDLICLDVMMPTGTEGFHFAQKVRHDPATSHIPIIMITSIHEYTDLRFSKDDGDFLPVDEFVEKPIKKEDLLSKVKALLVTGREAGAKKVDDRGIGLKKK